MSSLLNVTVEDGVARVVIDNPPLNLLDVALLGQLDALLTRLAGDDAIAVVVFDSADPDFFVAHGDMGIVEDPEAAAASAALAGDQALNPMLRLNERLRALPQVTIGTLRGIARGGGSELLLAMDLRFAALETAGLAQMEAAIGSIPGAGATVGLPLLLGRSRALEVLLGGRLLDAATAERYGWITRALPAAELDAFVDGLATRIARLAPGVVAGVKEVVDLALVDRRAALLKEDEVLFGLFARPASLQLTRAARAAGAQTRDGERRLEELLDGLTPTTQVGML